MKTKKLADFQICISVPLKMEFCLRKQETIHSHYTIAINTTANYKNLPEIYITGRL